MLRGGEVLGGNVGGGRMKTQAVTKDVEAGVGNLISACVCSPI